MSKYSHFEMCEKIFGQKYKWNEQKHEYEPYSRTDVWNKMIEQQDKISDLETKLEESEKSKESYRLQNEQHHLQLLQFYSRLGVEAFGADIHEKALETLMIMKEQLAEKEKEIEYQESMKILAIENKNQKAIEQLEKVLVLIHNAVNIDNPEYDLVGLYGAVSNQIKQLKEKNNG